MKRNTWELHQPDPALVNAYVGKYPDMYWHDKRPGDSDAEWDKDHRSFVLNYWLPMLSPPRRLWKVTAEAYIAGMEPHSDGSTVVPDRLYRHGNIKDPQGVMHDYLFELNRRKLPDVYGHFWTRREADAAYRDLCLCDGWHATAWVRWVGLRLASWWWW